MSGAMGRVSGEVNADFLPVTNDRTGFLKDSDEYREFLAVMGIVMEDVKAFLQKLTAQKEGKRVSRALKDALQKIYRALALNPDLSPFRALPLGDETKGFGGAAEVTQKKEGSSEVEVKPEGQKAGEQALLTAKKRNKKPKVKRLTPIAIIKRIKFGETGVSCVVDSIGRGWS
jgi:hypothetical protein